MRIETYTIGINIDTKQVANGLSKVDRQVKGLDRKIKKTVAPRLGLGNKVGGLIGGASAGLFLKDTLSVAAEFETAQSRVSGALNATEEQSKRLEKQARRTGATTVFSAIEAAQAQEVLAKNGLTYEQIMNGALDATLLAASALKVGLAPAADLVTDAMIQFNLDAEQSELIVNRLAGAANKSKFAFGDLAGAYAQGGGIAASAGVDFEDFNAAIAASASLFSSGSDAGTSFKTFILSLVGNSKEAKKRIKELGLQFFKKDGNLKDMVNIVGELTNAFKDMSEEARTEGLKEIFGADAARTAVALIEQGVDGYKKLKREISEVNAQELSDKSLGKYQRATRELNSAVQELQLTLADSGILGFLSGTIKQLSEGVRLWSQLFTLAGAGVELNVGDPSTLSLDQLKDRQKLLRKASEDGDDRHEAELGRISKEVERIDTQNSLLEDPNGFKLFPSPELQQEQREILEEIKANRAEQMGVGENPQSSTTTNSTVIDKVEVNSTAESLGALIEDISTGIAEGQPLPAFVS